MGIPGGKRPAGASLKGGRDLLRLRGAVVSKTSVFQTPLPPGKGALKFLSSGFFPGKHRLTLQLLDKEGHSWKRKTNLVGSFNVEIDGDTKKVVFFLKDGKLGYR